MKEAWWKKYDRWAKKHGFETEYVTGEVIGNDCFLAILTRDAIGEPEIYLSRPELGSMWYLNGIREDEDPVTNIRDLRVFLRDARNEATETIGNVERALAVLNSGGTHGDS